MAVAVAEARVEAKGVEAREAEARAVEAMEEGEANSTTESVV